MEQSTYKVSAEAMSAEAMEKLYADTLQVIRDGLDVGAANGVVGIDSVDLLWDLLHGGAYARPINELPFFRPDPDASPYYAGDLRNITTKGLVSYLADFFAGTDAESLAAEVEMNANVPHVLPKLISDQAYARHIVLRSQAASAGLFNTIGTGLKTYVAAGKEVLGAAKKDEQEGYSEDLLKKLSATLASAEAVQNDIE